MSMDPDLARRLDAVILRLTAERGPENSICPSEAARAISPDEWRVWLKPVRERARALAEAGGIRILRKGKPVVDPATVKGVIRLSAVAKREE